MFIAEMGLRAQVNHWEAKEAHIEHARDTRLDFFFYRLLLLQLEHSHKTSYPSFEDEDSGAEEVYIPCLLPQVLNQDCHSQQNTFL